MRPAEIFWYAALEDVRVILQSVKPGCDSVWLLNARHA